MIIISKLETMRNMKLHEIIETFEDGKQAIITELLIPYKKQLLTYYTDYFCRSEPILMVTSVTNNSSYAIIVSDFYEAIQEYYNWEATEEDIELISFQSIMLKDL